jgi:hypothetical protein
MEKIKSLEYLVKFDENKNNEGSMNIKSKKRKTNT